MRNIFKANPICYVVILAAHIVLVWSLPIFPTQDGPSHIYNLVILHDLLNGGKDWGAFYTHNLRPVPNLGFHILAYPLISLFTPYVAEKLFVSLYIVLMGVAVPVFLRSFERPVFPFSYFVFPVVFNFTMLMGFYSYAIAVPLFLIAFSLTWKFRAASTMTKFILLNMAGLILFYSHLIPFAFFLIALTIVTAVEAPTWGKRVFELAKTMVTISPLLVLFFLYEASSPKGHHITFAYLTSIPRLVDLTEHLFFFSMATFSRSQIIPAAVILFLFLFFLSVYSIDTLRSGREKVSDTACIQNPDKALIFISLFLVSIYYLAPFRLGEGSYFNQRFPWVIFLILLPLLRIPRESNQSRFASFIILCSIIPVFYFNILALRHESDRVKEFLGGLEVDMPTGSFVMGYKTKFPEWSDIDVLMHTASYYGIYKGCVDIGNYEAGLPYFPVRFKETLPSFPSQDTIAYDPAKINWSLYPCIGYLFAWDLKQGERDGLGKEFRIIKETGRLTVWERKPPGAAVPN
jgi:hypothetical protein